MPPPVPLPPQGPYDHVPVSVLDIFESHVARSPHAPALILEDGSTYSYRVLDALADAVGREAACAFVGGVPDTEVPLVAVMVTRGIGLVAGILGCLKAGAAYVPVDPAFPPDRQTYIFAQAKCQLLITDPSCLEQALALGVKVPPTLVLNVPAMGVGGLAVGASVVQRVLHLASSEGKDKQGLMRAGRAKVATREDGGLMYVLYTSGSTGKPKGVMVKHRGVTSQILWFADELDVGPHSRILGLATICFDISVLEMYLSLVRGAATVHCHSSTQKDPFHLLKIIRTHGISVMQATPTTYDMLFAIGWTGDKNIDFLVRWNHDIGPKTSSQSAHPRTPASLSTLSLSLSVALPGGRGSVPPHAVCARCQLPVAAEHLRPDRDHHLGLVLPRAQGDRSPLRLSLPLSHPSLSI